MRLRRLALLFLLAIGGPAPAAVTITFYSHELGSSFPHAFILLEGTPEDGGAPISANYGFTAKHVTPAILMGSVTGDIESASDGYVRHSQPHWRMVLGDGQYRAVVATMARWSAIPGRSYNLQRRNCVHFVADMARTLGLDVVEPKALMQKPRSFLQNVLARNAALIVADTTVGSDILATSAPADGGAVPILRATTSPVVDRDAPPPPLPIAAAMAEDARDTDRPGGGSGTRVNAAR